MAETQNSRRRRIIASGQTAVGTGDGLLGLDEEVRASVLGPAALGVLGADGPLLAVGDDGDAGGRQSLREQVVHGRPRAPLAQRQVVLVFFFNDTATTEIYTETTVQ